MNLHRLFFALCIATITSGCLFGGGGPADAGGGDPSDSDHSSNDASTADSGANGTDSDLARCAGSYVGTFDGDDQGAVTGDLDAEGTLTVTYNSSLGVLDSTVTVTEDGEISGSEADTSVTGTMDFSNCSMSGEWTTTGVGSGTWEASKIPA